MSTKVTTATLTKFQKLTFAKIEPSGNLIVLAGKNGAGKTSFNDGLEAGFTGHNGRNIKRPIKDGSGKASIEIDLSDGSKLIRGYTPSGTTLKGIDAQGVKFGQAQIDARLSSLGIDGRKFIGLDEKKQLAALLDIVDLPFKPAELDAQKKALEAERVQVGRDGKAIGEVVVDASLPTAETSAREIIAAIRAAEEAQRMIDAEDRAFQLAETNIATIAAQISRLTEELAEWTANREAHVLALQTLPAPADTTDLEGQLATVEEANAAIRANNLAIAQDARKTELRTKYDGLTADIKALETRKAEGLAKAVMPIEGLTFDDEGVLYQGVPFSRASGREQLIVSCAMIMATNPEIRVIVIRDGNVLDMEGMQVLQDMAEATDFQIFIEIVADVQGDHEHYFVDGELAE